MTQTRLRSVGFEVNGTGTDFVTADDQLATCEAITDDVILNTVKNHGTDQHACDESDDEDDDPPQKPPSHAEAVDMCAKLSMYLESLPDTHKYFPYINAIQNLASKKQFNSKKRCLVTDFFM